MAKRTVTIGIMIPYHFKPLIIAILTAPSTPPSISDE